MPVDLLNIFLAFVEGLALILSPCILPILPIILSGSIHGNRSRPYGIILGFVVSFALFTFFSRSLVLWFGINLDIIRNISLILLSIFGLIMVSTYLTNKFNHLTQGLANVGFKATEHTAEDGFASGIFFGALVGLIWTPCAGPILAAVIVQTLLQHSSLSSFFIIVAFAIGAGIPMLFISIFSRTIASKINLFQQHAETIRKGLGVIIILSVIFMYYSTELFAVSTVENKHPKIKADRLIDGVEVPYAAPEFKDITAWINTKPLTIEKLKGKVVLIDFWAYSCINCIRTLPYLLDWNQKYAKDGLVIVGVHSPEFDFERDLANVQNAVHKYKITYPVALDNNFATWENYSNHYWPAHYLINKNGDVVYTHFGEGKYDITENNIRYLLGLSKPMVVGKKVHEKMGINETPETYLGYARNESYSSREPITHDVAAQYSYPPQLFLNGWALQGGWSIQADKIVSVQPESGIKLHFNAKYVYAVMGSTNSHKPIKVKVKYRGTPVNVGAGADVNQSEVTVSGHNLYNILALPNASEGVVELIAQQPGLEIYTFTFGD